MSEKICFSKTITIGRGNEGKINLRLEIREVDGYFETVEHKKVSGIKELSICGDEYYKNSRGICSCGQILDDIKPGLLKPAKGYMASRADVARIIAIWKEWHLNTMNAACIHQKKVDHQHPYEIYKELAAIETKKCPMNYVYGSKWLVRKLPKEIETEIIAIFQKYEVI
jgi:hypothetical protein